MGNKVNFIAEVYSRLNTAIGAGKALEGVKLVKVGASEEARKENDLPIITIQQKRGIETAHYHNRQFVDEMTVDVTLITTKLAQAGNTIFKTSNSTGVEYILEALLNTLDKTTVGVIDLQFAGTVENLRSYSYEVDETTTDIAVTVSIIAQTVAYQAGGR